MSRFVQLHLLTSYPPANLNRDDLGRPKTAIMGGRQRLRISSQSLKRAWRTSDCFKAPDDNPLKSHLGTRTKEMGNRILKRLTDAGVEKDVAGKWTAEIAGVFGKLKKNSVEIEQLAHFSPEEETKIFELVDRLAQAGQAPSQADLALLLKDHTAVDIAMFGRMLADSPGFNVEAAVQVAHAITVHEAVVEDDFFTAVDDLNEGIEDVGAGHMGETEFAAGLFYLYVCIDADLLRENLVNGPNLAGLAARALTEAAATVAPTGKQNSFASRAYASYILAEKGDRQPRSLSVAFLKPVTGGDFLEEAVKRLRDVRDRMDQAYGPVARERQELNVAKGLGTITDMLDFVEAL